MQSSSRLELRHIDTSWQKMGDPEGSLAVTQTQTPEQGVTVYRVYKRRWFGLVMLMLLNIVVSWAVSWSFNFRLIA